MSIYNSFRVCIPAVGADGYFQPFRFFDVIHSCKGKKDSSLRIREAAGLYAIDVAIKGFV